MPRCLKLEEILAESTTRPLSTQSEKSKLNAKETHLSTTWSVIFLNHSISCFGRVNDVLKVMFLHFILRLFFTYINLCILPAVKAYLGSIVKILTKLHISSCWKNVYFCWRVKKHFLLRVFAYKKDNLKPFKQLNINKLFGFCIFKQALILWYN